MATTIKLKNSVTTTNAPSSLVQGEVAINITDKKVWVGNAATTPIQLLGDGGSVQFTTVDTTNLQVTNIKAKDGTASASIANSTGIFTHATATAFTAGTVSAPAITFTGDTNTGIYSPAADTIAFTEGGVESMRIDSSGNVGIGTTSPSRNVSIFGTNAALTIQNSTTGSTVNDGLVLQQIGNDSYLWNLENSFISIGTNNAERMRIDSSGNVGIGVTPQTWAIGGSVVQLKGRGYWGATATQEVDFGLNAYYDGSWRYLASSTAANYSIQNNTHIWQYAASGTAGNVITWSEAMRIDSSGNVGIGTSSPGARLNVVGGAIRGDISTAGTSLILSGTGSNFQVDHSVSGFATLLNSGGGLAFNTNGTERMRIDSSGNLLLGGTSNGASARFLSESSSNANQLGFRYTGIATYYWGCDSSGNAILNKDGTERMRITSDGEVYIAGTTDQGAYNLQCNGTGVWGAGAYVNGSDERIKDNIAPLDSGLDVVAKLNPVTYKYKENWSKDQSTQTGFIAQELLTALDGKNYVDGVVQQGGEYMSVAYQNIIPILTKAIQEQQAMIVAMQKEIAELKAK